MTSLDKIFDADFFRLAVLQVYNENAEFAKSEPSQKSEDWSLCSEYRKQLFERTRRAWSRLTGEHSRFFPWSVDGCLRMYLNYRKRGGESPRPDEPTLFAKEVV